MESQTFPPKATSSEKRRRVGLDLLRALAISTPIAASWAFFDDWDAIKMGSGSFFLVLFIFGVLQAQSKEGGTGAERGREAEKQ
jgi:hypothetical protein